MFNVPTTLILGAGASVPYGYPVGDKLKKDIISLLNNIQHHYSWIDKSNIHKQKINNFIHKLDRSDASSIDIFLENQNNETFTEIGKKAIVNVISNCESIKKLANPDSEDDAGGHWYQYFGRRLFRGNIDEITHNIKIITFNYDRSLETYLIRSLANNNGEIYNYNESADVIDKIPIIHMYGELDPLPCQEVNGRGYGEKCSTEEIIKLSENIHLIHEAKNKGKLEIASDYIAESEKVYFLGLDLANNLDNIKLFDLTSLSLGRKILATAYGLKTAERDIINDFFIKLECASSLVSVGDFDQTSSVCIREYLPF